MSIKDYPTEELLAEISTRVRSDSPLYDPQELRDMLIKSESECSELRAQVERLTNKLSTERDTRNQRLIEIYDRARKAENDYQILREQLSYKLAYDRNMAEARLEVVKAERDALQARIDAGVRVWSDGCNSNIWLTYALRWCDSHTALIIDRQPIADHVPDAEKMVDDDQKGEADRNTLTQDQFDQLEDLDR